MQNCFSRKIILLIATLLSYQSFYGQVILKVTGQTKDGVADTGPKPAFQTYFIRNADSSFEKLIYKRKEPCRLHETFKDSNFLIRHGIYIEYTNQGWVNEMGFYTNDERSGKWYRRIGVFHYAIEIYNQGKVAS